MKLNNVTNDDDMYKPMWGALHPTLTERDHEIEAWAAIGIKQYYYIFNEASRIQNQTASSTTSSGKAAGKGLQMLEPEAGACSQH